MYDLNTRLLVENPINRYSIGDRTEGLKYGDDGSLTIYVQKDSPGKDKESNWLPAPSGPMSVIARTCGPEERILDGEYKFPDPGVMSRLATLCYAKGLMSAFGTKQTSISTLNMSAFGGKADISDRLADVR